MMLEMRSIDVAIVGGGPGGAAAANSIIKTSPHLTVRVFERAKQLRPVGFNLQLAPNGRAALGAIDSQLLQRVEGSVLPEDRPSLRCNSRGEELPGRSQEFLKMFKAIVWHQLQHELVGFLPSDVYELGFSLNKLEVHDDGSGVTLLFDGKPAVKAKIVIGCDGNLSTVRQSCIGDGPPKYLGQALWRGHGDIVPDSWPFFKDHPKGHGIWLSDTQGTLFSLNVLGNKEYSWTVMTNWSQEKFEQLTSQRYIDTENPLANETSRLERCMAVFAEGWMPQVQDLLQGTDPATVTEHGSFCREADDCQVWGKGPVTLLGDAAHLATAVLGQGVNMALEDAVELGRAVGKFGASELALREYEAVRIPRATKVQRGSVELAQQSAKRQARPNSSELWYQENAWLLEEVVQPLTVEINT